MVTLLDDLMNIFNSMQGINIIYDFITENTETELLDYINSEQWNKSISRRTQHYGYVYDYTKRNAATKTTKVPDIYKELFKDHYVIDENLQVIINEYLPGQGIANHIDSLIFDSKIMSLSLGSDISMIFTNKSDNKELQLLLPRRSLLIIEDEARYKWQHSISKKKIDTNVLDVKNNKLVKINRNKRISITVRKLKMDNKKLLKH